MITLARRTLFISLIIVLAVGMHGAVAGVAEANEFVGDKDVVYAEHNGEMLRLDAYLHPASGTHPAIVFIHGGGFVTGDKSPCPDHILQPALKHNYSVFSVNYRLAPKHPYPTAIEDVTAAVRFIRSRSEQWRIDPSLVVLTGESAGGLISALTGATMKASDQVAAVMPICGEVDLELRVSEDPCCMDMKAVPRPPGGCISGGLGAFLGFKELANEAQRNTLRAASTVSYVRREMPPYLLIHGTRDFGVPYEQSVSLHHAMTKAGADCTLLPIVGGGHLNWSEAQWKETMDFAMSWLAKRLKR